MNDEYLEAAIDSLDLYLVSQGATPAQRYKLPAKVRELIKELLTQPKE